MYGDYAWTFRIGYRFVGNSGKIILWGGNDWEVKKMIFVLGLRFTNDCKRLISASGDGCIFVWKLPRDMVVTMQARLDQQAVRK